MKMISRVLLHLAVLLPSFILAHPFEVQATNFKASLAAMPQSAEVAPDGSLTGAYVELIRALDELSGTKTDMWVVPFKRSVLDLIEGRSDFHIPLIETPGADPQSMPYAFSTVSLFQVSFVLYTNKDKPLDMNDLGRYDIATDSAHTEFFPFPIKPVHCLSCAVQMVNSGRIDGFIFAQNEIDPFIKDLGLNNVHRQLYKNFNVKILIPKGEAGKEIDAYFTSGIQTLRERGEYDTLLAPVLNPYREWLP